VKVVIGFVLLVLGVVAISLLTLEADLQRPTEEAEPAGDLLLRETYPGGVSLELRRKRVSERDPEDPRMVQDEDTYCLVRVRSDDRSVVWKWFDRRVPEVWRSGQPDFEVHDVDLREGTVWMIYNTPSRVRVEAIDVAAPGATRDAETFAKCDGANDRVDGAEISARRFGAWLLVRWSRAGPTLYKALRSMNGLEVAKIGGTAIPEPDETR
jgi:hypothetical protein